MKKVVKKIINNHNFLFELFFNTIGNLIGIINKITNYYIEKRRFYNMLDYKLNLKNPKTFNEKMVWKKINNRNPLLVKTSDKYKVRNYVKEKMSKDILIPLLHVTDDPESIPFETFPDEFVVKANHASGWNIIVKNNYDKKEIIDQCRKWLKTQYGKRKLEWAYQPIQRKIIVEKLIRGSNGELPKDYKFFIFNSKCKMVQIDIDRFKNHKRSLYDENWNRLKFSLKYPKGPDVVMPENFKKMKNIAEKLAKPFNSVRVDLYNQDGKIYFGELTHYHGSGMEKFKPNKWDLKIGKKWKIV